MTEQKATNVTWHAHAVSKEERCKLNGHQGAVLWFTGLSACGTSTIANRDQVRALMPAGEFIEVYVNASLETCEKRDPKGLYKKARAGEIKNFTGISDPYEAPEKAELVLDADTKSIDQLADEVIAYLEKQGILTI